jgi:hypothetical protein
MEEQVVPSRAERVVAWTLYAVLVAVVAGCAALTLVLAAAGCTSWDGTGTDLCPGRGAEASVAVYLGVLGLLLVATAVAVARSNRREGSAARWPALALFVALAASGATLWAVVP